MTQKPTTWSDLRQIADELEVQIHLASMDAHDRWKTLQPRLEKLEKALAHTHEHVGKVAIEEVAAIRKALCKLRDDIARDIK
jgi:ElaB/YqjD/DUF883 family membrane-anchored ribosome-binding protein